MDHDHSPVLYAVDLGPRRSLLPLLALPSPQGHQAPVLLQTD